jgi:hypothetical protein
MIEAHQGQVSVNLNEVLSNHIFNREKMSLCPQLIFLFLKLMSASLSLFTSSTLYPLTFSLLTFGFELLAPTQTASTLLPDLDIAVL